MSTGGHASQNTTKTRSAGKVTADASSHNGKATINDIAADAATNVMMIWSRWRTSAALSVQLNFDSGTRKKKKKNIERIDNFERSIICVL
jgi:NRPS condensation-like uncharacterized protein